MSMAPNGQSAKQRAQPLQLARSTRAGGAFLSGGSQGSSVSSTLPPTSSSHSVLPSMRSSSG